MNFLSNRTQQAVVEGEHSCTVSVISGIPQGSILGQSLFLIYVNDLGDGIKSRVRLYADDSIFYSVIRTPTNSIQLQDDLRTRESWERKWLMSFKVEKCHQLTLSKNRKKHPHQAHPSQLKHSESYKGIVPWSRDDRKLPMWITHPVNRCKSQRSERLRIQEPERMPSCCPDTLLLRPCATSSGVCICGVGVTSATSAVYIGDGAATLSPLRYS